MLELEISTRRNEFELNIQTTIGQGVTAIFGPSGSGKTTLLRAIAGLIPTQGHISFTGQTWLDKTKCAAPYNRPIGLLFQDDALFPHLNILGNLNFALKRGIARQIKNHSDISRQISLESVIQIFELSTFLERKVTHLSGGERRRVAMARTLLSQPKLLLLDEPLSGMDETRKKEILPYLYALSQELEIPTVYVSHQLEEVTQLCQNMLIVESGEQIFHGSTPRGIDYLVSRADTNLNQELSFLSGKVIKHDEKYNLTILDVAGQLVQIPKSKHREMKVNEYITLNLKSVDVAIALEEPRNLSIRNILRGEIQNIIKNDTFAEVNLSIGNQSLLAKITLAAADDLSLKQGMTAYALLKSSGLE